MLISGLIVLATIAVVSGSASEVRPNVRTVPSVEQPGPAGPAAGPLSDPELTQYLDPTPVWANLSDAINSPERVEYPLIAFDSSRNADILVGGIVCYALSLSALGCGSE